MPLRRKYKDRPSKQHRYNTKYDYIKFYGRDKIMAKETDISKTSRQAIRKLVKLLKYYTNTAAYCEKGCKCEVCKAIRYAKNEDNKLTGIIKTTKRAREIVRKRNVK